MADGGYKGGIADGVLKKFGYVLKILLRKDSKKQQFKPISNRWVVERTFAWFDNDKRLCRNY